MTEDSMLWMPAMIVEHILMDVSGFIGATGVAAAPVGGRLIVDLSLKCK